jgi:hypothetical protein
MMRLALLLLLMVLLLLLFWLWLVHATPGRRGVSACQQADLPALTG